MKLSLGMQDDVDLSIIAVSYNTAFLLERMLSSVYKGSSELRIQIVVVDNASSDNSVELLRSKFPSVQVIANTRNLGFARANNQALSQCRGRYILLLNTDAFVSVDSLPATVSFMDAHPDCGVLGVRLTDESGHLQPSCRFFPTPWNMFLASSALSYYFRSAQRIDDPTWDHSTIQDCDWVPGCYYLIRREVVEQVGLFDPRYFLYWEEVDHCKAVKRAGWRVVYFPHTSVVHIGGESASSDGPLDAVTRQLTEPQIESELLYVRKHHGLAGLMMHVCLTAINATLKSISAIVKHRDRGRLVYSFSHIRLMTPLLCKTCLGSRPTR